MYAIISDSGRQYQVTSGQELDVDFREAEPGEEIAFERVLLVSDQGNSEVGTPTVDGAQVTAEVVSTQWGKKIHVMKFRRRKNSRRKTGHRQLYTRVRIKDIQAPGFESPAKESASQADEPAEPNQPAESEQPTSGES